MKKRYKSLVKSEQRAVYYLLSFEHTVHPCDIDIALTELNPELKLTKETAIITKVEIPSASMKANFKNFLNIFKRPKS
ncbi:hypothetical protein [Lentimicrobium sp. S6]|uniref:hypothetical protein n=1 Tax=Lentimicrobium sp. S6 TaxID=2735872 RepID=UPI0015570615|nr:hypothetical protein [Lentimicrobium sp. S6]NPD48072.1 hypothetical protein [Lentimicrobium sp. S6]